jgi:hypothetical protein
MWPGFHEQQDMDLNIYLDCSSSVSTNSIHPFGGGGGVEWVDHLSPDTWYEYVYGHTNRNTQVQA